MPPVLPCIVGPTACGKTAMGVALAKRYNGEVVSVDSMQIYRGMSIGTAAPTPEETGGIPHHMVAIAGPDENWSAARFTAAADSCIQDILGRNKLPVLVGGTGLYLDAVIAGRTFAPGASGSAVRRALQAELEAGGIEPLLAELRRVDPEAAARLLGQASYEDLGYAKVDHQRKRRQGAAEVIFGQGKTAGQIEGIVCAMIRRGADNIIITRLSQEKEALLRGRFPYSYSAQAQLAVANPRERALTGSIAVVSAGTSDAAVCEEAALTAEALGSRVHRVYDAGVAGLHRLLGSLPVLEQARCIVAVAGMEGALPSVVGGLVSCPVIAVPTSVGYGANLGGLAALLAMLNSCASGVSVVNIDNGFGAGFLAHRINQMRGIGE